jgi:hypothetical protein
VNVRPDLLQRVLSLLCEEETALSGLLELALQEQAALINSDFEAITSASNQMLAAAERIEHLEATRLNLLRSAGLDSLTLEDLLPLADDLGVEGFASARLQLGARARELRDAQEQNARLLLNAMKLRDRWANLLGGFMAPGYGSNGRRNIGEQRGTVSRSA